MIVSVKPIDDATMRSILAGRRCIVVGGGDRLLACLCAGRDGTWVVSSDPGSPVLGPPAAVSLGVVREGSVELAALSAVGTLDAARYRLAVVTEVAALVRALPSDRSLVVAAPAITRGIAAVELVPGLVRALGAKVVVIAARRAAEGTAAAAHAVGADVLRWVGDESAPTEATRRQRRSELWAEWMQPAEPYEINLETAPVLGAPPPVTVPDAWLDRIVGLLSDDGRTVGFGRIAGLDGSTLQVLSVATGDPAEPVAVVVRDAMVGPDGRVRTAPRATPQPNQPQRGPEAPMPLPRPPASVHALLEGAVLGGLLGDPIVVLEHARRGGVILIDLGEHPGLPVRLAHRVAVVLLSHTHMDHFAGIHWLLRRRVGVTDELLLVGPDGTSQRIAAAVDAFTWDRIGADGPRLRMVEVGDDGSLTTFRFQIGRHRTPIAELTAATTDGPVVDDGIVRVRAAVLDHGGIPVLAYRIEEHDSVAVRSEQLQRTGLPAGPWVGQLKERAERGRWSEVIDLPDGRRATVDELATDLLERRRGQCLVYATDVADTPDNRQRLITFAHGADLLICEAAFADADRDRAEATGHLTARACGEIAAAAEVTRLLPFHLSNRYQRNVDTVLDEVRSVFPDVVAP